MRCGYINGSRKCILGDAISILASLWENGKIDSNATGVEKFKLINKDGEAVDCEISIKQDMLIGYLQNRILQGLIGFFTTLKVAFEQHLNTLPGVIHILLAGNSSRSNIVLGYLGCLEDKEAQELNDFFTEQLQLIFDEIPKLEVISHLIQIYKQLLRTHCKNWRSFRAIKSSRR